MITQTVDPHHYVRRARQIKAQIPIILSQWGLVPRFNHWRLAQDPETGMVVLFGVLNNKYIATHTTTPFSNYFDPRLLHDLETELHVQVISSTNDGLRYAFILERGEIDLPPVQIDPMPDKDRLIVRVVYSENRAPDVIETQVMPAPQSAADGVEDQTLVDQGVGAFLKVFEDIKLKNKAVQTHPVQDPPDVSNIDNEKLNNVE